MGDTDRSGRDDPHEDAEPEWVDLAGKAAGIGVTHEAAWRRHREGAGADLSWRVGAEGEAVVGALPKARREADRVRALLAPALVAAGHAELADRLVVFPAIVLVVATLQVRRPPSGVLVVRPSGVTHPLTSMTRRLDAAQVGAVYGVARRSTTWVRPPGAGTNEPPDGSSANRSGESSS